MKVFFDVEVLAVISKAFTSNEGEDVSYKEVYMLNINEDGSREVFHFNSKAPTITSADEGVTGVAEVEVDAQGVKKPRLIGFKART